MDRTKRDIILILQLIPVLKTFGYRPVLSGGYGTDSVLGKITRAHNDIDMVVYGSDDRPLAVNNLIDSVKAIRPDINSVVKQSEFLTEIDFHAPGLGAGLYYVQTKVNPYQSILQVVKSDGTIVTNSEDQFPLPVSGKLNGVEVEAEEPNYHLADILYKSREAELEPRRVQDIANLRQITDSKRVAELLKNYGK